MAGDEEGYVQDPLDRVTEELRESLARLTRAEDFATPVAQPPAPVAQEAAPPEPTPPAPQADTGALVTVFRRALDEHLETMSALQRQVDERTGTLSEHLQQTNRALTEHVDATTKALADRLDRTTRVLTERLDEIVRRVEASETVALEDRLRSVVTGAEGAGIAQLRLAMTEASAALREADRRAEERQQELAQVRAAIERLEAAAPAANRNAEVLQGLSEGLQRLTEVMDARFARTVEVLETSLRAARDEDRRLIVQEIQGAIGPSRAEDREALTRLIEERFEGLARFNRSDHEKMAQQVEVDQEMWKQTLRSVKELQASVANEVAAAVDRRFDAFEGPQREALRALDERIQSLMERALEQQDSDLRAAMDQMGEVMRALASRGTQAGRAPGAPYSSAPASLSRTELDPDYRDRR